MEILKSTQKAKIAKMLTTYGVLLIDNREQTNHIEKFFSKPEKGKVFRRVNVIRTLLNAGDYSFMIMPNDILGNLQPMDFRYKFIIEKKSGASWEGGAFAEMKSNLIPSKSNRGSHSLFKKEFQHNCKEFVLLLENTESEKDLFKTVRGKVSAKVYFKIYNSFIKNRNSERAEKSLNPINIVHCSASRSGLEVKNLILSFVIKNIQEIQKPFLDLD